VNYTELVAEIQSYTQNYESDFVANIPTFVDQAETRIYNTVQIPALRKNVTGATTNGNKYLSCPSDFLSVFSIAVIDGDGNYEYLLNKDVNFMRASYPNPNTEGLPKYYALFGPTVVSSAVTDELSFILAPTPDDAYDVELHYYYYPESITTAADGRTWLGDNYSPVLLYGSLVEAYIYMKGEADMMTAYEKKYQDALAQLNRLGTGLERGDAYRDGQAKIKVNP
jgi:hypothetical protein